MCGIAGVVCQDGGIEERYMLRMRETLRHRGPDDEGLWISKERSVGLVHCRLAIIDLSCNGHQPMSDVSGRYWITFNGEIYNYHSLREELEAMGSTFRSTSD